MSYDDTMDSSAGGGGFADDMDDDAGYDEFDVSTIDFGTAPASGLVDLGADGPEDATGLTAGETRTAADMGIGSLAGQVMPDSPGIMEILTAPIEALVSLFTMGAVDLELTGKDVLGVPGMSSSDLSRGMAGLQGPQPVGVEIGLPGIGGLSFSKEGVDTYGGPITDFLGKAFNSDFATKNPEVTQVAAEKVQAAQNIARQNIARDRTQKDFGSEAATMAARDARTAARDARTAPPSYVDTFSNNPYNVQSPTLDQRQAQALFAPTSTDVNAMNAARNQAGTFAPASANPLMPASFNTQAMNAARNQAGTFAPPSEKVTSWKDLNEYVDRQIKNAPKRDHFGNPIPVSSNTQLMPSNIQVMEQMAMQQPIPAHLQNIPQGFTERDMIAAQDFKNTARGWGNTLSDWWNAVQQKAQGRAGGGAVRGPVTGGQRSGGIMSLR